MNTPTDKQRSIIHYPKLKLSADVFFPALPLFPSSGGYLLAFYLVKIFKVTSFSSIVIIKVVHLGLLSNLYLMAKSIKGL